MPTLSLQQRENRDHLMSEQLSLFLCVSVTVSLSLSLKCSKKETSESVLIEGDNWI